MRIKIGQVACVATLLIATPVYAEDPTAGAQVNKLVFGERCTEEPRALSAFLAPFVSGAIDAVVGSIIGAVKRAGDNSTKTLEAFETDFFFKLDASTKSLTLKQGCLGVVFGKSKTAVKRTDQGEDWDPLLLTYDSAGEVDVDLISEYKLVTSPDGASFRIIAHAFYVKGYLHKPSSKRARSYVTTIEIRTPNTEAGKAFATLVLPTISKFESGNIYKKAKLDTLGIRSQLIPMPAPTASETGRMVAYVEAIVNQRVFERTNTIAQACAADRKSLSCFEAKYPDLSASTYKDAFDRYKEHQDELVKLQSAREAKLDAIGKAESAAAKKDSELQKEITKLNHSKLLKCKKRNVEQIEYCLGGRDAEPTTVCPTDPNKLCDFAVNPSKVPPGGALYVEWSVAVTETKPGSKFFKKLGEILESGKSGLMDELKGQFDPATKAANAATDETTRKARVQLFDQLRKAQQTVQLKEIDLAKATTDRERLTIEFEIVNAKHTANELARQIGITAPYSEL